MEKGLSVRSPDLPNPSRTPSNDLVEVEETLFSGPSRETHACARSVLDALSGCLSLEAANKKK